MDQQISADKEAIMGGIISSTNDNNAKESSDTAKVDDLEAFTDSLTVLEDASTSQTSDMDEELWLEEPTDVKVETDEDFDVIVKSLETAIVQTEIYDVPDQSTDLILDDLTKESSMVCGIDSLVINPDILSENILLDTILPETNITSLQINDSPESPEKIESSDLIEPDEVQNIEDTLLGSSFEDIIPETPDPSEEPPDIILAMDIPEIDGPESQKNIAVILDDAPEINIDPEDEIIPETPEPAEEPQILDISESDNIEILETRKTEMIPETYEKNPEIPLNTSEPSDESNCAPESNHPEIHLKNIEIPELDKIPDLILETPDKSSGINTNAPKGNIPEIIDPPFDPIKDISQIDINTEISSTSVEPITGLIETAEELTVADKLSESVQDLSKSNLQVQTVSVVATPEFEVKEPNSTDPIQEIKASLLVEEFYLKPILTNIPEREHAAPEIVCTLKNATEENLKETSEEVKIVLDTKTVETETKTVDTSAKVVVSEGITPEINTINIIDGSEKVSPIITPQIQSIVTCPENKSQPVVSPPETKLSLPEIKPIIISPVIKTLPTEIPPENPVSPSEIKSQPIGIFSTTTDILPVKQTVLNPLDLTPPEIVSHPIVKPVIEIKTTDLPSVKHIIVNPPDVSAKITPPEIKSHPSIVQPSAIEIKLTDSPAVKQIIVNPPDVKAKITPPEIKSHPSIVQPSAIEIKLTDTPSVKQTIVNPPDTETNVTLPEIKSQPIVKPSAIEIKLTDIPSVQQSIVNPSDTETNVTPPQIKSNPIVKPVIEIESTDILSVKQTIETSPDMKTNITPPEVKLHPIITPAIENKPTDIPFVKQTVVTPLDVTPPEIGSHPIVKTAIEIADVPSVKQSIDTKTNPPEIKSHPVLKPAIEIKPTDLVKQTIENPPDTQLNVTPVEITPKPIEISPAMKVKAGDVSPVKHPIVNTPETISNVTPIEIKSQLPVIKPQSIVTNLEIIPSITQSSAIQATSKIEKQSTTTPVITSLETLPDKPSKILESLLQKQTKEEILLELQTKEEPPFENDEIKSLSSSEYQERSTEKRCLETEDHTPPKKIKLVRQKLVKPARKLEVSKPTITKSVSIVKELPPPVEEVPKQRVAEVTINVVPSPDLKELLTDSNLEQKDITSDEVASPDNKSIKKGKVKLRRNYRPPDVAKKSIPVDQKMKLGSHIQKQDIIPDPGHLKEQEHKTKDDEPQVIIQMEIENSKIAIIEKSKLAEESKIDKILPAAVVPDMPEVSPIDSNIPEVLRVKSTIPETQPIESKMTNILVEPKIPDISLVSNIPAALTIKSNTPNVLSMESKVTEILLVESKIPEPLPVESKVTEILSVESKIPEPLPVESHVTEVLVEAKIPEIISIETKIPEALPIKANTSKVLPVESKNTEILTLETNIPEVQSVGTKITEDLVESEIPQIISIESKIPEEQLEERNILEEPTVILESPCLEDSKEIEKEIERIENKIELNETTSSIQEINENTNMEVIKITKDSITNNLEVMDTIISAELLEPKNEKSDQEIVEFELPKTEISEDIDIKILDESEDQSVTNTSSETETILSGTSTTSDDSENTDEMETPKIQSESPETDTPSPLLLKIEEEMKPVKIEAVITATEVMPETPFSDAERNAVIDSEIVETVALECKDTGLKLMPEPEFSVCSDNKSSAIKLVSESINMQRHEFSQSIKGTELKLSEAPQIIPQTSIRKSSKRKAEPIESIIKPLMVQVDDLESSSDEYEPKPSEYYPKIVIKPIPKPDQPRSPKITIKPIVKPPEIIQRELKLKEEASTPRLTIKPVVKSDLKITITKQKHDSHSILKIYKPGDDDYVPKLTIKPIPEPMQHSPRISIKPVKSSSPKVTVKPILPPSDLQIIHSPKMKSNHEESYPKVTIKPILRPEELSPRHMKMKGMSFEASSGITVEPIPSQSDTQINTPKISVKPFAKLEEALSPKLTIKPIIKTCEIGYSEEGSTNPLKLTIKPIKSEESYQSPKITIKPILKMDEEEDKPERIILKIQKSNLPSPSGSRESYDSDKKLDKIKLKLTKEGSHAQIIPSGEPFNLKRSLNLDNSGLLEKRTKTEFIGSELLHSSDISINLVSPNAKPNLKQFSEEVTIVKIEKPAPISQSAQIYKSKIKDMLLKIQQKPNITCTQIEKDDSSSSDDVKIVEIIDDPVDDPLLLHDESSSQDVMIVSESLNINPFKNVQIINPHSLSDTLVPGPKKRGRPRKNPLEVKPELKDEDCMEVVRPKRTCRAPPGRTPFAVKERKPRGARARGGSRGRGVGRGGIAGIAKEPKPLRGKALKQAKALAKLEAARLKQEVIIDEIIIEDSTNDTTPAATPIPPADESPKKLDIKEPEPIVEQLMIEPVDKIQQPNDEPSFPQPVAVYEDETQMSADCSSRAQTPARQVIIAPEGPEESQSSIQSSATTESNKTKKGRMEVCDADNAITLVDQIVEYSWSGGGPYMLQEQIAQYLGVKSFKRKYPGLTRRPVEMQERDYIREKGLVSESMCDMGLTAVPSSEILDIMYTDFQEKYEEYRKCLRDKQSKEITSKQKAISLATSQEKNKIDFKERAIRSAANWNLSFNKSRNDSRKCCMDLQTFTINFPTGSCKVPQKAPVGKYPIALVPGQFTDYYKSYTTNDLKYLPLNSVKFGPVLPNQQSPDLSDGSLSDSDSSSGSDSDSSDDSMSSIEDAVVVSKPASLASLPSTPKARVH